MPLTLTVAVIGDYDPAFEPHAVTNAALAHSAGHLGVGIEVVWAATKPLDQDLSPVEAAQALLCAPGSPYGSLTGALRALRFGREHGVPVLGTCAGCQHAVIEYARNVLGFEDAQHAEYDPYGSRLFVSELACSLAGKTMPVTLDGSSRAARMYGATTTEERYYCNFGINPAYEQVLHDGGLLVTGRDADGEARVLEIPAHPFYIATLFVPQARSTPEAPHPLVTGLLRAAIERAGEAFVPG